MWINADIVSGPGGGTPIDGTRYEHPFQQSEQNLVVTTEPSTTSKIVFSQSIGHEKHKKIFQPFVFLGFYPVSINIFREQLSHWAGQQRKVILSRDNTWK